MDDVTKFSKKEKKIAANQKKILCHSVFLLQAIKGSKDFIIKTTKCEMSLNCSTFIKMRQFTLNMK